MNLKLGTSGYSFDDWQGVFYPGSLPKNEWFDYYCRFFETTEINMTYYQIPSRKLFDSLNERSPDAFELIVKVNRESTHVLKESSGAMAALLDVTAPVRESGKLCGYLAQFPYSFRNTGHGRKHLVTLADDCAGVPLFVEFRHVSWNKPPVFDFLRDSGVHYCCVDEPQLKGLLPPQAVATGDTGYVRMHGRNSETWWDQSKGDRYDYRYDPDELTEWIERLREIGRQTSKTYLFFNNCHAGHAVRNAKMMAELLKNQLGIAPILNDIPVKD